jgi:hypothetical protein
MDLQVEVQMASSSLKFKMKIDPDEKFKTRFQSFIELKNSDDKLPHRILHQT